MIGVLPFCYVFTGVATRNDSGQSSFERLQTTHPRFAERIGVARALAVTLA